MDCNFVFQDDQELHRLAVQNRLLREYELPVLHRILAGKNHANILDIGCNDGRKTVDLFSDIPNVQVIGLEYHEDLAVNAQKIHGNDRFTFIQCNVEHEEFARRIPEIMREKKIASFDVIYLSFVLMHLADPVKLLKILHSILAPSGRLVIVEPCDRTSVLVPDEEKLLNTFLEILSKDPLAGNRTCGYTLLDLLKSGGYQDVIIESECIRCDIDDISKKRDIFETFFSYLPQDLMILCEQEPKNMKYQEWRKWMDSHYEKLKQSIMQKDAEISMGLMIVSCTGGDEWKFV